LKSCSNDDAEMPDYSTFFNEKAPSLYGKFNSQTIYWGFCLDNQMFYLVLREGFLESELRSYIFD